MTEEHRRLVRTTPADFDDLDTLLHEADLTRSGLQADGVTLWILRDHSGAVYGSTGYELSPNGDHALIRSVAVAEDHRGRGLGRRLAQHALTEAARGGATRAWLFSRRSGPFWQQLGFTPADRAELAQALGSAHQVQLFRETGQLDREVAWSRSLVDTGTQHPASR